jgi:hypothetical protein
MTCMNRYAIIVLISLTILLGGLRLVGFTSPTYQAFAHLFVGGVATLAIARKSWLVGSLPIALSVVEVFAFFTHPGV